jgi:hypothetical protein
MIKTPLLEAFDFKILFNHENLGSDGVRNNETPLRPQPTLPARRYPRRYRYFLGAGALRRGV